MTRKTLFLLLALLSFATVTSARQRAVSSGGGGGESDAKIEGATVSGIVSSVSGSLIRIADDLVTIESSGAKIVVGRAKDATLAQLEPGMLVFAVLKSNNVAANAPLPAELITATPLHETSLIGPVQTVDVTGNSFTMLGRTIHVTSDTSFGGLRASKPGLGDLLPNQIVQVQAEASGNKLVALSVLLLSPVPTNTHVTHGTVKSLGSDSWTIAREKQSDLTLVINAQTKIAGSPKVGDPVEVLYTIDSANQPVAIVIAKFERPTVPPIFDTTAFRATVKKIGTTEWTVTLSSGSDQLLAITDTTKIMPGIKTGDRVEVLAQKRSDGTLAALAIVKLP